MTQAEAEPEKALSSADYEALARFRYTLRRFLAFSASAAHAAGLPPQQHQALLAIKGHPGGMPMTVGVLAEQLTIAPHTATGLVDRMTRAGLLVRGGDRKDRRRVELALTTKAEEMLRTLTLAHMKEIRGIAPLLLDVLRPFAVEGQEGG